MLKNLFKVAAVAAVAELAWEFVSLADYYYHTRGYDGTFDESNTSCKATAYMLNLYNKKLHANGLADAWDTILACKEQERENDEDIKLMS